MFFEKYRSPLSGSYETFQQAALQKEIIVTRNQIIIPPGQGKLAERIVSHELSRKKSSLIDRIMDFILDLFSRDYREAKKLIGHVLGRYKNNYFAEEIKKDNAQKPGKISSNIPALEKVPSVNNQEELQSVENNTPKIIQPKIIKPSLKKPQESGQEVPLEKKNLVVHFQEPAMDEIIPAYLENESEDAQFQPAQ